VQEAALLKELANGTQWRIDAVMEAVDQSKNWYRINNQKVFEQIGTYGRLSTLDQLCSSNPRFKKFKEDADKKYPAPDQIRGAFDQAVLFGHFGVADYCQTLGKCTNYMIDQMQPRAMAYAVDEGNERKMDYMIKAGEDPSYHLLTAVHSNDRKTFDFLLDRGADINTAREGFYTPFLQAVKYGHNDLAKYILEKGADLTKTLAATEEALYVAIGNDNIEMVQAMMDKGVRPDDNNLAQAKYHKKQEMIDLITKYMPKKPSGRQPSP
jgi:hypothetical protein